MPSRHDTAARWNATHPPGTAVLLALPDGTTHADHTAGAALPWGSIALVPLVDRRGLWPTHQLTALSAATATGGARTVPAGRRAANH